MSIYRLRNQDKVAGDSLDYDVGFSRWLTPGDTIVSAEADPASTLSVTIEAVQISDQSVKVWISGGVDGEEGDVVVTIITAAPRTKNVCFRLRIRDC